MPSWLERFSKNRRAVIAAVVGIILFQFIVELLMHRPLLPTSGGVHLWYGLANGPGDSQNAFDPYSASHILHGLLFFLLLQLVAKKLPLRVRFLIALLMEVAWELFENSPIVIARYQATTISDQYTGDTILNSMGDLFSAALGFLLVTKWKTWQVILGCIAIELLTVLWFRDSVLLNIIMLIHPVEVIKQWQMG